MLVPKYRGDGQSLKYDPQIIVKDININAEEYTKLKVRMKVDFYEEILAYDHGFTLGMIDVGG